MKHKEGKEAGRREENTRKYSMVKGGVKGGVGTRKDQKEVWSREKKIQGNIVW